MRGGWAKKVGVGVSGDRCSIAACCMWGNAACEHARDGAESMWSDGADRAHCFDAARTCRVLVCSNRLIPLVLAKQLATPLLHKCPCPCFQCVTCDDVNLVSCQFAAEAGALAV